MIYKRKIYSTFLLLALSLAVVKGEGDNQQLHHEQQQIITQHKADNTKNGQELYQRGIELLWPYSRIQKGSRTPKKEEENGISGIYNSIVEPVSHVLNSYTNDGINTKDKKHLIHTKPEAILKQEDKQHLLEGINLLKEAADNYGNKDALFTLADMYFYEKYYQPRDYKLAFDYYQKLADTGNATAQHMLGFIYSTGIGNVVERDQAQALLYLTFAAHGGDTAAEMTLGYRYFMGIGTEQSCNDAVYYYKKVADKAIGEYLSGPLGGLSMPYSKVRLSDDNGGVYGYGASHTPDKSNRQSSEKSVSIDEVLEYLRYLAEIKGDMEAQFMLVETYYHGSRNVPRDFKETLQFLEHILSRIPHEKISESLIKSKPGRMMGQAAGYLGRMYLRGEGVKMNIEKALKWFEIGAEFNDGISLNGLGMIHMTPEYSDYRKALEYFKKASNLKNADASVNLAVEYINDLDTLSAGIQLFEVAAKSKHILAYWHLGKLHQEGIGVEPSCQYAVNFYKGIAERGDWSMPTVADAYEAYKSDDVDSALLYYMLAAERGYEIAQSNVAYLLDTSKVALSIPEILGLQEAPVRNNYTEQLALIYWSRSANQNNADARIKMGDYYYYGIGTPVDYEKAASCYRMAVEADVSPMAMWNLGWMYENGIGVAKDFHLAKRQYDIALTTNANAYLPVKLSLLKLHLKYYWDWFIHGDTSNGPFSSTSSTETSSKKDNTLDKNHQSEGIAGEATVLENARRRSQIEGQDNERQREDKLRMQYNKHMKELDDHDEFDDLTRKRGYGKRYDDNDEMDDDDLEYSEEDELIESLIILGICVIVGWLVYYRQFRFGNQQQQQQQQPLQQQF